MKLKGLYALVDDSILNPGELAKAADMAGRGGACAVQLRSKHFEDRDLLLLAKDVGKAAKKRGALFIMNDRPDMALLSGADGVHLGQDDLPAREARKLFGRRRMIVGISTHDLAQARKAEAEGADYIGFGPIFHTTTKEKALPPRGPVRLRAVLRAVRIPVVAIGGINPERARMLRDTGCECVAVVSNLLLSDDIRERAMLFDGIMKGLQP
jgi:thiamine-phosphate diphosphorylase